MPESGGFLANLSKNVVRLSTEGKTVASGGSPEAAVFALVPATGSIPQDKLAAAAGPAAKVGLAKAVQNKWLEVAKEDGARPGGSARKGGGTGPSTRQGAKKGGLAAQEAKNPAVDDQVAAASAEDLQGSV